MNYLDLQQWVIVALFTTFIIIGAQITVPLGTVPFVLSDFFVILSGLVLGNYWGTMSVVLYLLLGAIGLPVFAGFSGGYQHFIGPTGGYLLGFLASAFVAGSIAGHQSSILWRDILAAICAMLCLYLFGLSWLVISFQMTWKAAFLVGMLPFLVGAAIKLSVAVGLASVLRRNIARFSKHHF